MKCEVERIDWELTTRTTDEIRAAADRCSDCTDNFATRFSSTGSQWHRARHISAAIRREGQILTSLPPGRPHATSASIPG